MFVIIMDYLFDLLVPDSEEIKFYKAMKETEKKIIKSKIIGYTLADARKRVWPIIIEPYTQCTDKMMTNRCIVEVRDSKISKILVIG